MMKKKKKKTTMKVLSTAENGLESDENVKRHWSLKRKKRKQKREMLKCAGDVRHGGGLVMQNSTPGSCSFTRWGRNSSCFGPAIPCYSLSLTHTHKTPLSFFFSLSVCSARKKVPVCYLTVNINRCRAGRRCYVSDSGDAEDFRERKREKSGKKTQYAEKEVTLSPLREMTRERASVWGGCTLFLLLVPIWWLYGSKFQELT